MDGWEQSHRRVRHVNDASEPADKAAAIRLRPGDGGGQQQEDHKAQGLGDHVGGNAAAAVVPIFSGGQDIVYSPGEIRPPIDQHEKGNKGDFIIQ